MIIVPEGLDIIFENDDEHPDGCSFLVRIRGYRPDLWELIAPLEKEKVNGWWRIWSEDFYKVVKRVKN